jgi:glycosyltransferase involved in cell wall biosynthesis
MAAGAPVIAYGAGGLLDSVRCHAAGSPAPTGLLFPEQTLASLVAALLHFEERRLWHQLPAEGQRQWAERFAPPRFRRRMGDLLEQLWAAHQRRLAAAAVPLA